MKKNRAIFLILILSLMMGFTVRGDGTAFETAGNNAFDDCDFYSPRGICDNGSGGVYVADTLNHSIRLIGGDGGATTIAGHPAEKGGSALGGGRFVDGKSEDALFSFPNDVAVDSSGNIYVCDTGNERIRKIDTEGNVTTFSGTGEAGFENGSGGKTKFNMPVSIAADKDDNLYVADTLNHCIRKISKYGVSSVFAGMPGKSGYKDGAADGALFFEPAGIAIDGRGVMYVADSANHVIRKIENGMVSTLAGKPAGQAGEEYASGGFANGENGQFNFPKDVAVYKNGLFVADTFNHAVRYIDRTGNVTTVLGNGVPGQDRTGIANITLSRPYAVEVAGDYLYVSDTYNDEILKIKITGELLAGRPTREEMLESAGLTPEAYEGKTSVYISGSRLEIMDIEEPVKEAHGIVRLPVRAVFEALGYKVVWNETDRTVTLEKEDEKYVFTQNDYELAHDKAFAEIQTIKQTVPAVVEWFPENNAVIIVP